MRFAEYIQNSTAGIITAWNPQAQAHTIDYNRQANLRLRGELEQLGYRPRPVTGHFMGHDEEAFLVPNITREDLIALARKYNQMAVAWGEGGRFTTLKV